MAADPVAEPAAPALSWRQKTELFNDGFTILRGAVAPELVERARAAIQGTEATSVTKKVEFEQTNLSKHAARAGQVGGWPEVTDIFVSAAAPFASPVEATEVAAAQNASDVLPILRSAVGPTVAEAKGLQVALTLPTEPGTKCMQSGWPEAEIPYRGWAGHLDAIWNGGCPAPQSVSDPDFDPIKWYGTPEEPSRGTNGNPQEHAPGMNCGNFTCLVGISLSDQETEGMGNVGVLRVSHTQQLGCALPRVLCRQLSL